AQFVKPGYRQRTFRDLWNHILSTLWWTLGGICVTHTPNTTVEALLREDASQLGAWLERVRSGESQPPEGFNWHGFAEGAAFLWRRSLESPSPDQRWGRIAIAIYDWVAARPEGNPQIASALSGSASLLG